jgi:hypothetical protein
MTTPTFNNSYFITNRNDPTTIWVDSASYVIPGPLLYYTSSTPYDQTTDDYSTIDCESRRLHTRSRKHIRRLNN